MLLYFLVEDHEGKTSSFELEGHQWHLTKEELDVSDQEKLNFICISYTWGNGRVPGPFRDNYDISDRTIPALIAAMTHRPSCKRFWIDALCVPAEPKEKMLCLESMGFIYSRATEVIVVLSTGARAALEQMNRSDQVNYSILCDLEKEEWISRAWTYQEV